MFAYHLENHIRLKSFVIQRFFFALGTRNLSFAQKSCEKHKKSSLAAARTILEIFMKKYLHSNSNTFEILFTVSLLLP